MKITFTELEKIIEDGIKTSPITQEQTRVHQQLKLWINILEKMVPVEDKEKNNDLFNWIQSLVIYLNTL